jgi:hypothetical protein
VIGMHCGRNCKIVSIDFNTKRKHNDGVFVAKKLKNSIKNVKKSNVNIGFYNEFDKKMPILSFCHAFREDWTARPRTGAFSGSM